MNTAMRKIPDFYGEKEIAIVESGEQTGMLRTTFDAIAKEMRMQEELRRKVLGALTYPFIIMIFLMLALIVVMVYVIPQIMPIIAEMTTDIPFSTRSLIAVSDFFSQNLLVISIVSLAFCLLVYGYSNTEHGRRFFDREKLSFPIA
jgi:type II secretory pathway component PulF